MKVYKGKKLKNDRKAVFIPTKQDIYFLKVRQYALKEDEVKQYLKEVASERKRRYQEAEKANNFHECPCCGSEDCLLEEMLSWSVLLEKFLSPIPSFTVNIEDLMSSLLILLLNL